MKMDRLSKWLLLPIIYLTLAHGQSRLSLSIAHVNNESVVQTPPLQLTMKILSEEYCVGDSELDGLRLKVRLIYTNKGKQQLILYKGSRLISRTMVSRNFADAAAKRFEVNSSLTQLTSGGGQCYTAAAPGRCFVVLPPGASYEVEGIAGTFVVRGDAREITGAVQSGKHVLHVEVITWHESDEMAKKLRARWLRYGVLWYEPITSAPVPFTVKQQRRVVDCP